MPKAFEVTIQGTYQNQLVINRLSFWNSLDDAAVSGAFPCAQALGFNPLDTSAPTPDSVLDTFLIAQTQHYQADKLFIRNLFSVTDFYQALLTGVGWAGQQVSGTDGQLSFVTQKLTTNRIRTDVRAGTLALTPPSEEFALVDGVLSSGATDLLQDLCNSLNAPPEFTSGQQTGIYVPSVFKKVEYTPDPLKPEKTAYKYPDDIDTLFNTSAIGVTWSYVPRLSSQVSRKVGKGR